MKKILLIFSLTLNILSSLAQADTILCYNGQISLQPIDSNKYINLLSIDSIRCIRYDFNWRTGEFREFDYLKPDNPNAYRINDTLYLKLSDNSLQKLITEWRDSTGIDFKGYYYIDYIEKLGLYVIKGSYYESADLIIVSRENGNLTHVPLQIAVYPQENILIGAQYDLVIEYYENDLIYYKIDKSNLIKQWEIYCEEIGFNYPILTKQGEILLKKMEKIGEYDCCKTTYSKLLIIN
jgi:hypothetical protein